MSRCFPFPPPGYEKKARTDDVDLLKKEKHREKKHKKEKDKEKRENKEKREKEGRDVKHKEKKDKKEKHREKKKDKDKDKDKDKSKISADEKGFPARAQGPNAGKLHQNEIKQNDKGVLFEDRLTKQYASNNGEKARENNHLVEENKDSKFLMELDRRIRDNDGGAGNQLVQKFTIADRRRDEGTVRLVAKSSGTGTWPVGKEKFLDKGLDAKKIDGRGIWVEARPIGNATVQNHAGNCYPRVDEKAKALEKNFDKTLEATVEGTERVKKKNDDKRGDKRKEKEKEKKGHGKDKNRDKEKKKEDKAKEKIEHKNREKNKSKESKKAGSIGLDTSTQVSRHSNEKCIIGENIKKRKEIDSNGALHVNDSRPNKLPRPSSSHHFTENGSILKPCQISLQNTSDGPGAATNVKVANKERKINGIIEALPSAISLNKPPTAPVLADPVTHVSTKPPHPDTKYLSQVYSVPKAYEWSDFDEDQEWLFGSSHSHERKPVVKSTEVGNTLQVWAEGMHIEPADIFALPYVIPY